MFPVVGILTHSYPLDPTYPGEQLWRHIVKPYSGPFGQAAGDMEGALPRALDGVSPICLPATW